MCINYFESQEVNLSCSCSRSKNTKTTFGHEQKVCAAHLFFAPDSRWRHALRAVCVHCSFINYSNPKILVGSVVHVDEHILLCRRAIEPRHGYWTLPAGFLENNETAEAGAAREAREEALAEIAIEGLLAVYSLPHISQIQLIYRARLSNPKIGAGAESLEVALVSYDKIPWNDLAFPSVHWALKHFAQIRGLTHWPAFTNRPDEPGTL
jgi:ADP-ribose pyrophosphatase YjhB (NUDIX family)